MLNKEGAPAFQASINAIPALTVLSTSDTGVLVVDGRPQILFQSGHLPGAINIPDGLRFETWLGSIVNPGEAFYLLAGDDQQLQVLVEKAAKIGYEQQVVGMSVAAGGPVLAAPFYEGHFTKNQHNYTIVDIRNSEEVAARPVFAKSIPIPLPELRAQAAKLPKDNPLVVHCAGGYRSTTAATIITAELPNTTLTDRGLRTHDINTNN